VVFDFSLDVASDISFVRFCFWASSLLGTGGTMFFRQKPGTGGWIDETHAVKALTSLPSTWAMGTVYAAGAWTSVYGSGVTGATPVATPVTTPVAPLVLAVSSAALSWTAKVGTSNLAPGSVSIKNRDGIDRFHRSQ
jgi:hypothetical protein